MHQTPTSDHELLEAALRELEAMPPGAPSGPAVRELVEQLAPVIRHRVTRHLLSHRGARMGAIRPLVDEFTQMVFGKLFENRAQVLRIWDPEAGLSLRNWVGRVASLRTRDVLRSRCRDPWLDPTVVAAGSLVPDLSTPDEVVTAHELWGEARAHLHRRLTPKGWQVFELLFEQQTDDREVAEVMNLSDAALWRWRHRLRKELRVALDLAEATP